MDPFGGLQTSFAWASYQPELTNLAPDQPAVIPGYSTDGLDSQQGQNCLLPETR
jgi:hypothetical protein